MTYYDLRTMYLLKLMIVTSNVLMQSLHILQISCTCIHLLRLPSPGFYRLRYEKVGSLGTRLDNCAFAAFYRVLLKPGQHVQVKTCRAMATLCCV